MALSHSAWAPSVPRSILALAFLSIMWHLLVKRSLQKSLVYPHKGLPNLGLSQEDHTQVRSELYSPECVEGEFCETRPEESRLLSGERHRRGAAQGKTLLRSQDDRRVRRLHPPQLPRWPLVYRFLKRSRLDHQLAGVDERGQPLLLLQGCLQLDRPHPVEGDPNGAPLPALLDEQPELLSSCSAQGVFLRSHEQL